GRCMAILLGSGRLQQATGRRQDRSKCRKIGPVCPAGRTLARRDVRRGGRASSPYACFPSRAITLPEGADACLLRVDPERTRLVAVERDRLALVADVLPRRREVVERRLRLDEPKLHEA